MEECIAAGELIVVDASALDSIVDDASANDQVEDLMIVCGESSTDSVDDEDLIGQTVNSLDDAYEMYNQYAFRTGFSIRKDRQRFKAGTKIVVMKRFCCYKAGEKQKGGDVHFHKIDTRCHCKALVQFDIDAAGLWTVTRHERAHNHVLVKPDKAHHLRSQRKVTENQLRFLEHLKESGVNIADGIRLLKKQSGGSPFLGFGPRDAYNSLANEKMKTLDGSDSNALIEIFRKRQSCEKDFFFDFEVDGEGRLCSFFWRDLRMKTDYELFGDLLVHDTTYRTNKYDMICAPFVGMNHHCANVMFGCGFLLNERIESFVWLFNSFLRSMGGKHPITIMTDQCAAMSAAIIQVFPNSRHRLCVWHIGENSKKNIKGLRSKKGFIDLFNYILKYSDSEAEFEVHWTRLEKDYGCHKNSWIQRLFDIREKWCPAFNKDFFSGGVLSSQRSEATNFAVSRRLARTAGLCDFYNIFCDVILEWRSKENVEDFRCVQGEPSMVLDGVKLLCHAKDVYTIEIYKLFEEQYMKGCSCHQVCIESVGSCVKYHVWRPDVDIIRHEVIFDTGSTVISCTCKFFSEVGILCCHCLRVFNMHCLERIPEQYVVKRWCRLLISSRETHVEKGSSHDGVSCASSLWRLQMIRNFNQLVSDSELNLKARQHCEEAYEVAKKKVVAEVGSVNIEEESDALSLSSGVIKNPASTKVLGVRNRRFKSVVEKKSNVSNSRRKVAQLVAIKTKGAIKNSMQEYAAEVVPDGYLVHPTLGGSDLVSVDSSVGHFPVIH